MESLSGRLMSATIAARRRTRALRIDDSARVLRARVLSLFTPFCLLAMLAIGLRPIPAAAQNPIVLENQNPGTNAWYIQGNTGSDSVGQISGYMSATSVNKGQPITFYVSVNPSQTYTIDVYRLGWYQGLGGRLMQHIGPLNGTQQPTCPMDPTTGMIECQWAAGYTLTTQTTWTSGVYLAVLTNSQNYHHYTHFVVRDDSRVAALMYQLPDDTYQAYNDYPYDQKTGKSLYSFDSYGATTVGGTTAAVKVSFDRPYDYDGECGVWGYCVLAGDAAFIHWLEKSGYDVTYSSDVDTHTNGAALLNYRGFISGVHNEYWSKAMYDNVTAARDGGVNLFFSSANAIYWQIRYESSSSGVPNRVIVCYRDATIDPTTDPTLTTVNWRDPPLNRPEQELIGIMYTDIVDQNAQGNYATYVVNNSSNWVYAGTGFKNGDTVAGVVGYEADRLFSNYTGPTYVPGTYTLLSDSPFKASGASDYANSSIYQAPSGAWVFASGTVQWANALDGFSPSGLSIVDSRLQQTTANVLNQFISNATVGNFTLAASPTSQTVTPGNGTSYGITITPSGGFTGQVTFSASGLPSGAVGSFAPNPATSSSTFSVTTSSTTAPGTYPVTITGISGTVTKTTSATLIVSGTPDFSMSASPPGQTVVEGSSTNFGVTVAPVNGFTGQVTLSVSGLPAGAQGSFNPNPATGSSTLLVTTLTSTPVGAYTLTITGVSGTLTHTTTVTLSVSMPDFSLSASPSSQLVTQAKSTSYSLTITPILGFTGQVTLSLSGLPTGAIGSFTTNPATATSTLNVTTTSTTSVGTSTLTITGTSGALIHTATVTLTVSPAGVAFDNKVSSGIQFGVTKITTPSFAVGSLPNRAAMIMVAMSANTATNITASLGGVAGTLIPGTDSGTTSTVRTMIFQVINPHSGAQTATVSWTTSMSADVGVIAVSGANQSSPTNHGTFSASKSSPTAGTSVTITGNPGDLTASIGYTGDNWKSPYTNQTLKWGLDSGVAGGDIGPGTGTTTHTWTDTYAGQTVAVAGANFSAASNPDFSLSVLPSSQTLIQGNSTSYNLTVNPNNGFSDQVTLSVTGLPTGVSGTFSPNPATSTCTLSVTTATTTPVGTYTLTITGISGSLTHTTTATLVVTAPDFSLSASPTTQTVVQGSATSYNLTINPVNGFAGQVTFSVSGLPTGASGTFSPNPATSTSALSVTTSTTTPAGTYAVTITGVSGSLTHTTTVTLIVAAPDFSLSASPSSQTVPQGSPTNYNFTINPINGFTGQVTFSLSGLPTGADGTFSPNPATSTSALSVTTSASTPAGTYTVTITGVSGSLTHTTTVTLIVTAPDFSLAGTPTSQTVVQGNGTSYNLTITPTNGFSGQVTLSATGLPTGASGAFSPNPATSTAALSVTTSTTTPAGTYTVTITGVSGALTHTTTVTLVVNALDFSLSASPSSQTVLQGNGASYNLTINPINGFTGQVTFSVSGLPAGANGTFSPNPATSTSALSVTTSLTTPTGTYPLTLTGVSGSLTHSASVTLIVTVAPNFTLSASPSSQTVVPGGSTTYGATVGALNGFTGQVTLSVSGFPTGASGTFSPNPATSSSTLSVTTTVSTPIGSYPLTITGTSGALTHTATVTLVVSTVAPSIVAFDNKVTSDFSFGVTSITTPAFIIGSGSNRAAMIMVAMTTNTATNITATLGGVVGTLIPGTDSGTTASSRTLIFQLINPPSGSQTATVSWTGSASADFGVITVTGASQTTPTNNGTFAAFNSSPASATSVTITSNSGDLTASVGFTANTWISPYTNRTLKWGIDSGAAGGDIGPGTGTTTHTWTDAYAGQTHAVSGANFKAAGTP